ncbi:hypothetical protein EJF18_80006 [Clavispora lusitaniae]|uniref:Uncharacterized protein n=2 Tax=Clavispora lusitaniae TaxID=36911 RepID=C4YCK8_CLAL4|nr:uncharacterized protein CLUG_05936 [Clavispora lusitaniae ATCC 42720]KAF5208758.1 hypothetical protein E0198_005267 [Clavispora lusitaniae]EEQ41808.1 predicted protein [Clavispora lusitaniae ATCC 42720]KAF7580420.1 hypothetical protein FOB63_004358 [Clavispora lusitaniae]QFZ30292.1 hypothetical protein EJF14_80006 [Clavispora lusitaniae]QFZ35954.1 hypothetical protein EJF16_80006 [Clavispora lusitaniae]
MSELRLRERNTLQDLKEYEEIIKRSTELEKDIPPRRKHNEPFKPGRKRTPVKIKKEKKDKHLLKKPAFKPIRKQSIFPHAPIPDSASFVQKKVATFEQHVMIHNSYEKMIQMAKDLSASKKIDFGLSSRLLPKNLDKEKSRYTIENREGDKLLLEAEKRGALFSNDIDMFFRKLSDSPFLQEPDMHSIPFI